MGAGKIMVLAVALLATYVLFAGASMRLALKAREVKVPDLTNRTANDAKAIARRQRSIKVWLSAGPRVNTIPALGGETERTAQLRLAQDGLTLASVSEIRSPDYASDIVLAQEPPAKSAGTSVALLVNRREHGATYVMPDLIGVNGDRGAEILRARGFRVAVVGSNPYPGVAAGIVIHQSPQAGFQIAPGEPISLEVSR